MINIKLKLLHDNDKDELKLKGPTDLHWSAGLHLLILPKKKISFNGVQCKKMM